MLYVAVCSIFTVLSTIAFRKTGMPNCYSKGVMLAILSSLIANISLAENISHNKYPQLNDGYGISNPIAYSIIGEDRWSLEWFQAAFDRSLLVSCFLIAAYAVVAAWEFKRKANY